MKYLSKQLAACLIIFCIDTRSGGTMGNALHVAKLFMNKDVTCKVCAVVTLFPQFFPNSLDATTINTGCDQ